ncbi:MAG TPA: hypothetical protein VFJ65_09985, partial [Solirubrobacterales bacterium]|nr:hypothetical protein [Solirubrobacterales bacterium]
RGSLPQGERIGVHPSWLCLSLRSALLLPMQRVADGFRSLLLDELQETTEEVERLLVEVERQEPR